MIAIRSVTEIRLKVQQHVRTHVATAPNSESDLSANATKQTRNEERIDEMKATRDQARIDAERSRATVENAGQIITATQPGKFAQAAHRRVRGCDGGYRRHHLRALAQRVEVSEREVRTWDRKTPCYGSRRLRMAWNRRRTTFALMFQSGGAGSRLRTRLWPQFPVQQGKYRELRRFPSFEADYRSR